jgi:FtsZ-binding cell division protein ZapB
MVKVSGVPYDVTLPNFNESESLDNTIATLELEIKLVRARNTRLEDELRVANEIIVKQNIENINLRNELQALQKRIA